MSMRLIFATMVLIAGGVILADERNEQRREALLAQMRSLAEKTKIEVEGSDRQSELMKSPIFRYDDQPRRFIDATIWAWTDQGRPVAFQKIEAVEFGDPDAPSSTWQYCFASLSSDLLRVEWPDCPRFRSTKPGIEFRPLEGAPEVAEGSSQRKRQTRELARKFSARIITSRVNDIRQQMRLLTTPLMEYVDPKSKEFRGAVFGMATNGTNPDLLIVLEIRESQGTAAWHYAPARMTCGGVNLAYRDREVWQVDWVDGSQGPFPTWTFFSTERAPLALEDKP
ncbi:MAG TPA: hypothetical protein VFB96_20905 [Pirellulaceae bacterium]|jgi:hypothetical protein|nr:hypothetical protein [Pirellulaceae bacterium]